MAAEVVRDAEGNIIRNRGGGKVAGRITPWKTPPKEKRSVVVPANGGSLKRAGRWTESEVELFAEIYVQTSNKVKAYRAIRPQSEASDESIEREVRRMVRNATFARTIEAVAGRSVMTKARLNAVISDEVESAAREGRLVEIVKLVDVLCKMNGYYEAQKIDVRHGAIDEESRGRALQALRSTGAEFVDAVVVEAGERKGEVPLLA